MPREDRDVAVADDKRATRSTAPSSPSNFTGETDIKAISDLPSDSLIITQSRKSSWKDLFAFTKLSHGGPLLAALVSSAIAACFKVALAVVLGQVFDLIGEFGSGTRSGQSTMVHVARWTLIIFGLGVGNWIANSAFLALWIMFGELQASSVREDTFHSLLSKDMAWFDSQDQGVSSLLVRIQTQTRELQLATSQILGLLVCDIVTAFASIGVAFYFSWKITLVLLATLPVAGIILSLATRPLEPAIQTQRVHLATASKHATSSLLGIDLVKVFGGYKAELRHYTDAIHRSSTPFHVQAACSSFQMGFVVFWVFGLFIIGFWYGLSLVKGGLSPGNVMTTFYATLTALQGFESLMPHWLVLAKGMSAGGFLSAVVSHARRGEKKIWKMGRTLRPTAVFGDIKLTNVSFAYPSNPNHVVLSRSAMSFQAGKMTFIVGRSGSGKSTVGNLVANLYEPITGDIQLDGHSMRVLNERWIREHITLVQQSSVLFNDTLFNNIALGHPYPERATPSDVLLACTSAVLQSTLSSLPQGLETQIGPEGHNLSGGQKQRLALARARLRDPTVLILDEVTSGLDPVSRTLVMHSIRRWRRNKTTIIITHDVSQIDDDDYVYVMDSSYLVQQGLKRDLRLQYGGHYSQLMTGTLSELAANHPAARPADISIIEPASESPELTSSVTPVFRSRSTRVTDYMMRELEANTLRLNAPRHAYRLSLALKSNPDLRQPIRESQTVDESPVLPMMRPVSFRTDGYDTWDEEIKRFSTFVSHQFSLHGDSNRRPNDPDETAPLTGCSSNDKSKRRSSAIPPMFMRRATILRNKLRSSGSSLQGPNSFRRSSIVFSGTSSWIHQPDIPEEIPLDDMDCCQCGSPHSTDASNGESSDAVTAHPDHNNGPSEPPKEYPQGDEVIPYSKPAVKQISLKATLRTVWPTLAPHDRFTLICGLSSSVISAAANPVFSYCFAKLLAVLAAAAGDEDGSKEGMKWALVMVAMGLINSAGWGGSRYMLERVGQAWVNSLRAEALRRILLQPKPWFGKAKNSPGRITECLDRNAEEIRNLVGKFVPIMTSVVVMVVISIVWALVVSWKLTLVTLAPCPVIVGAVKGFAMISGKWEEKCNKGAEDASASVTEIFLNIRVVKALTLEKHFTKRYESLVANTLGLGLRKAGFVSPLYGLYQSSGFFLTALVFYYGTVLLADERKLNVAEVMQVVNLLLFGIGTATGLLISVPQLTIAQATASQMLGYANMPVDPPEDHHGTRKPETPLPIKMNGLGFMYSRMSRTRVLNGVSLDIHDGDCTAIVGPSGCGKSTIISLILGLYHPLPSSSQQRVSESSSTPPAAPLSFGGVASTDIDIQHLRSMMAYVPQAPYLFPATIADNINYGLPDDLPYRSAENISRAAEAAGIHDWVMSLPDGYNTLVGDGGQTLSGGQAQRLCIARALVRKPRVLVLDEPTSALDAESAEIIRQTIRKLSLRGGSSGANGGKGPKREATAMSIVMVTHNREMMAVADWIIMLGEEGSVVEEGRYADLWEEKGHFWRLVSQTDDSWKDKWEDS